MEGLGGRMDEKIVEQFSIECCIASIATNPSIHFGFRCTYKTTPFIHFSHYQVCHSKLFYSSIQFYSINLSQFTIYSSLNFYKSPCLHPNIIIYVTITTFILSIRMDG